jgi:hypothetical protein
MHVVCYLRHGSMVFETYWTTVRGVEAVYSKLPVARPDRLRAAGDVAGLARWLATTIRKKQNTPANGRPTSQWSPMNAGYSDDVRTAGVEVSADEKRRHHD